MTGIFEGKRILITGGTGSLGQVLARRLLRGTDGTPESVTVFSRDEAKQHYMRLEFMNRDVATDEVIFENATQRLRFMIGDVRDYASVVRAAKAADIVFCAAALKQVPSCEYYPWEACRTNIEGAVNLVRAIAELALRVEVDPAGAEPAQLHPHPRRLLLAAEGEQGRAGGGDGRRAPAPPARRSAWVCRRLSGPRGTDDRRRRSSPHVGR